jgi:hypothetical protein
VCGRAPALSRAGGVRVGPAHRGRDAPRLGPGAPDRDSRRRVSSQLGQPLTPAGAPAPYP